jgi:hypothetical protein
MAVSVFASGCAVNRTKATVDLSAGLDKLRVMQARSVTGVVSTHCHSQKFTLSLKPTVVSRCGHLRFELVNEQLQQCHFSASRVPMTRNSESEAESMFEVFGTGIDHASAQCGAASPRLCAACR